MRSAHCIDGEVIAHASSNKSVFIPSHQVNTVMTAKATAIVTQLSVPKLIVQASFSVPSLALRRLPLTMLHCD